MNLKPLGHRVLIKPDEAPDTSAGGLVLPQDHDHVSMSGTVVAVGKGSRREWAEREWAVSCCIAKLSHEPSRQLLQTFRDSLAEPTPSICVGDRVVFSAESGLTISVDGEYYIILNEDDAVLVEEETEAVA